MRSERYCGTEGGGMDQAICFLAERHKVDKAASQKYNERVVECRLAAQVLACYFGEDWKAVRTLRDAQEAGHKTLEEMSMFVKENLHTQSYGIDEICSILKTTEDELMALSFPPDTYSKNKFELQRRALHVFAEAARVYQFELFLKQLTDGTIQLTDDAIEYLGKLMNESHISCRNLFECSCTELEDLRTFCLSNGAVGCRLTGAGWGGATVSIVKEKMLDKFCKNLRYFYKSKGLSDERIAKNMIVSCAGDGAKITNRKAIHLAI
ncbi:unnamed protein product [Soboliphyme baturini]|uniref:GHMP_kinases_C domain-containing protein n=1 Tax=Soboliphyme baturini TaxID=241478 RepID=A0A183IXV2_9BILA|nr:unnamed protein product [Soboliphyme baturini]